MKLRKLGLRVSLHFYNPDNTFEGLNPCGVIDSGEIRDFGLDIQEGTKTLLADFSVSSPSPSLGQEFNFTIEVVQLKEITLLLGNGSFLMERFFFCR